jgi:hypothetical protein
MLARTPLVVAANTAQSVRIEIFLYITTYLDGNTEKSKSRALFVEATNLLRVAMKAELESAVNLPIGRTETTPLAKTVRTCAQLLTIEPALWTFVDHQDLQQIAIE